MGLIQMVVAKGIVASAFRNGPLEDIHADGRVSQDEIKALMKHAVDHVHALLQLWQDEPEAFSKYISLVVSTYTMQWDEPENYEQIKATVLEGAAMRDNLAAHVHK